MNTRTTREVAAEVGCREVRSGPGGRVLWECDDEKKVVPFLRLLAARDAKHRGVRRFATRLFEAAGRDPTRYAQGVHRMVLEKVEWRREKPETFQHTLNTLRKGWGDCDDHARAIYALLRAVGIPAKIVIFNNTRGKAAHAVTIARLGGRWVWLETSVAAAFGEHPMKAAQRLGLRSRLNFSAPKLNGVEGCRCSDAEGREMGVVVTKGPDEGWGVLALTNIALDTAIFGTLGAGLGAVVGAVHPDWSMRDGMARGSAYGAGSGFVSGLMRTLFSRVQVKP